MLRKKGVFYVLRFVVHFINNCKDTIIKNFVEFCFAGEPSCINFNF